MSVPVEDIDLLGVRLLWVHYIHTLTYIQ